MFSLVDPPTSIRNSENGRKTSDFASKPQKCPPPPWKNAHIFIHEMCFFFECHASHLRDKTMDKNIFFCVSVRVYLNSSVSTRVPPPKPNHLIWFPPLCFGVP